MKTSVQQMQGVSAYIETHYEALAYCRQEKKVCHYREYGKCANSKSIQCDKVCIGYTKCADFISNARYNEKLAESFRTAAKKNQYKKTQKFVDSKPAKSKNKAQKKLQDNALGNDPKLKAIFEQFKSQ